MTKPIHRHLHHIWPLLAVAACALIAWCATLIRWKAPALEVVPFAILAIVLLLGLVFGRAVGILGSVTAAVVFAYAMYEPLGSLRIANAGARSGIAWMLLAGVTLSYLLLPARDDKTKHGH